MNPKTVFLTAALMIGVGTVAAADPLTPLVVGWEQFFTIDWQAAERRGTARVHGHIRNDWGIAARQVKLLVDSLDGANVVAQRVEWLGGELPPGVRAQFDVPVPRPAPAYRVSVFSFEWVQRGRSVVQR